MKRILSILSLFMAGLVYAQIPTASLVGYWPFNGNANDFSGYNNHGTVHNAVPDCDRCGNPASTYFFNGTNANIIVNNSPSIDMGGTDFSISFWMKVLYPPNEATPISKNPYGMWGGYQFYTNNTNPGYCTTIGQLSFYTASGATQDACSNGPVATGSSPNSTCTDGWYHIVGVWDDAAAKGYLYVNGILQTDIGGTSGNLSSSTDLFFGSHTASLAWFKGWLDDIRIYKIKLTQSDINALYAESCTTGISSPDAIKNNITVFPNPASETININYDKQAAENLKVEMKDVTGRLLFSQTNATNINVTGFANGIYFLQFSDGKSQETVKINIQH